MTFTMYVLLTTGYRCVYFGGKTCINFVCILSVYSLLLM